ncbi:MAG: outer membrane beta-barrel protein, partial [Pseudomonadota bacterium]
MTRTMLSAAAALCVASAAVAEGLYVSGGAGALILQDADLTNRGAGATTTGTLEYKLGYGVDAAIGWDFGDARIEIGAEYQQARIDPGGGANPTSTEAYIDTGLNAYYAPRFDGLRPYVGAGVAWSNPVFHGDNFDSDEVDETDTIAVKGIAGLEYAVIDRVSLAAEYRFTWSPEAEFQFEGSTAVAENARKSHRFGLRTSYALWSPQDDSDRRRHRDAAASFAPGAAIAPSGENAAPVFIAPRPAAEPPMIAAV